VPQFNSLQQNSTFLPAIRSDWLLAPLVLQEQSSEFPFSLLSLAFFLQLS
jgi:hypothetical protein